MSYDVHGTQSWVDLASPDSEVSKAFYCGLFGWDSYTLAFSGFSDYEILTEGASGPGIAGVQALADDTESPSWTCVFRVDDVDACVGTVEAAGGRCRVDPTDVAQMARIAQFADPQGAEFGVWQPGPSGETTVIGDRSAACFVELACRDLAEAGRFYGRVFGWSVMDADDGHPAWTRWKVGDQLVAGGVAMDDSRPADRPSQWTPYFDVPDCDAATGRAVELGARVRVPPADIDLGRFSIMTDPTGVRFALIALAGPDR
ncbi:VOC family protein [Actinomadura sp. NTSP31]